MVATAGAGGAGDECGEAAEDSGGDRGSWLRVGRWWEGVLGSAGGRLRGVASLTCLDGGCGVGLDLIGGWDPGLGWGPGGIGGGGWGGGGGGAVLDAFVGAFAVDGGVVDAGDERGLHEGLALLGGDGADLAVRGVDEGALHDAGSALVVEEADEGFADLELGDAFGGVEVRVGAEGVGGGLDRLLVARGKGTEGVLDAVAELAENGVGDVGGVLGDEVDADGFRADEADHLLDAGFEDGGLVGEEEVGLVEEEDELGFIEVAGLGEVLEELGEEPEEEGGVELGGLHEAVGGEEVDDAAAGGGVGVEEVGDVEGGLAEEEFATLAGELDEAALDGADGGGGDVAVLLLEGGGVFADVLEGGLEVFKIEEQEAVVVSDFEDEVEDAGLDVVEVEDAGEEERPHLGDGGADGMALLAEDVPEGDGGGFELEAGEIEALEAGVEFGAGGAGLGDTGEVAFDVGGEDGDADAGEGFGHDLEGDGFAGAGSSGDEAVAVGHAGEEGQGIGGSGLGEGDEERFGHGWAPGGQGCR